MMTEKQKKLKAERDRRYREKKKLEKAAEADQQAPIDPAPESSMQSPSVMELTKEEQERYREELLQQPVIDDPELTAFDVQKRRMMREGRR